jgi:prephenate dehydratase
MYMPIHHHLASTVPFEKLRVIYAHPQTHEQCSDRLEEWGRTVIHTSSNASSALEAKKTPNAGAILSASAASLYKMQVIVSNVQNNSQNITRFVRISQKPLTGEGAQKCSIVIDPDTDRAGLLHDLLAVFARRRINLTRIESRPSKRGIGNYVFFLDYDCSPGMTEALEELKAITSVKELGCYKKIGVPP